jgi:hypothetical protein
LAGPHAILADMALPRRKAAAARTGGEPPESVGSSNWRSVVLRQAERLTDELALLTPEELSEARPAVAEQVRHHVRAARAIALARPRIWERLRDWWTGNSVETAWNHLQTAREDLFLVEPSDQVRAQLPALQRRMAKVSPDPVHDPQLNAIKKIAAGDGDLSPEERSQIEGAHEHVRVLEDNHTEARQFRNNLVMLTAGLTIGAIALAAITTHGFRYLLVGAGAGLLTTALAWRGLTQLSGPYAVNTAQAALKVPAGAAAAVLGVILVKSGIISGLNVNSSVAYGYAVVFGLSQQALTQVVDNAAKKIGS